MNASIFHHLALPSRLPGSEDRSLHTIEAAFVDLLTRAARSVRDPTCAANNCDTPKFHKDTIAQAWHSILQCLSSCNQVNYGGTVNSTELRKALVAMSIGASRALLVHVRRQNAAIFIYRLPSLSDRVHFEVFETSAKNQDVLAADDALQWDFPGTAIEVPLSTLVNPDFQHAISAFLEQASLEATKGFAGTTAKAGVIVPEHRDTANPAMISSMLMAVLEEGGRRFNPVKLRKRIRDDVCWQQGSHRPWRRSPYWLALRVAISRYLILTLGEAAGLLEYKFMAAACLGLFLDDAQAALDVEQVAFLKAKICRRFAKLHVLIQHLKKTKNTELLERVRVVFGNLTLALPNGPLDSAGQRINKEWDAFKKSTTKKIPRLRKTAFPEDLELPLSISGGILGNMRRSTIGIVSKGCSSWTAPTNFSLSTQGHEQFTAYATPFLKLVTMESALLKFVSPSRVSAPNLSKRLHLYVDTAKQLYRNDPEQLSVVILNTMEIWMVLDKEACSRSTLFAEFPPIFAAESLNHLQLASFKDMMRLQEIQAYLHLRATSATQDTTVFADPCEECFVARFFDEADEGKAMRELRQTIEADAQTAMEFKYQEWQQKRTRYEKLTLQFNESTCVHTTGIGQIDKQQHFVSDCLRCRAKKELAQLQITVHEHPLPEDETTAKAVVFELVCPSWLSLYRDATWMLVSSLGSARPGNSNPPTCTIREYVGLKGFVENKDSPLSFTLGSKTKSFLQSHWMSVSFPVGWEGERDGNGVCRPNPLKLSYFDKQSKSWARAARVTPIFAHHFGLRMPKGFPVHHLQNWKRDGPDRAPTSYEAMATQMDCPPGLSPHEFLAFKSMAAGYARRWIYILVELGSSNVNWSSEAATMLLHHLALECGPRSEQGDPLRLTHSAFRDQSFVKKLLDELNTRLATLKATISWRETNLMDTLITLSLRVRQLAEAARLDQALLDKASAAVVLAREICIGWLRHIRAEIQGKTDTVTTQGLQQYALGASLQCRRTFVIHLDGFYELDAVSLEQYVEATIAMQENMPTDSVSRLAPTTIQHLTSSIKLSHNIRELVVEKISDFQHALQNGLRHFWPEADRMSPGQMEIECFEPAWVSFKLPANEMQAPQIVYLDLHLGCFLINGKPVGKLPQDSQNSSVIRELFKGQPLRAFQSSMPGMTYSLVNKQNRLTVHIGYDGPDTIILAEAEGSRTGDIFRYVPREVFHTKGQRAQYDLPGPLIDGRIHWLNLKTGDIYITTLQEPWIMSGPNVWTICKSLNTTICRRKRSDRHPETGANRIISETVVDPSSKTFQRIAGILEGLAPKQLLVVVQPEGKCLEVYIHSLQLMFFVSSNRLLYSPQLGMEIDPNQDIGTWYGLSQKLTCRSIDNQFRRTVLVPLGGQLTTSRQKCHVVVQIGDSEAYGKFSVNDTLGRIDCAAEPRLLYTKAMLHAYTSFVIPDPLTGRTGSEESLHWLQSGACQPWTVLGHSERPILEQIGQLTPERKYYPPACRVLREDTWNQSLTCHIQHPLYRTVVNQILNTSKELEVFSVQKTGQDLPDPTDNKREATLDQKAWRRRKLYERPTENHEDRNVKDMVYVSRDVSSASDSAYKRVMEATRLLRTKPAMLNTPKHIAKDLAKGNLITGYGAEYTGVSIGDRMSSDIRENWGPLVSYSRGCNSLYTLIFLYAALSFPDAVDGALLKGLISFAILPELREIQLPCYPSYTLFRPGMIPRVEDLVRLMTPFVIPPPLDALAEFGNFLNGKQRRKSQARKEDWERKSEEDCTRLAKFLLAQWPCGQPTIKGFPDPKNLKLSFSPALDAIQAEWSRLYRNHIFGLHLQGIQKVLDRHHRNELRAIGSNPTINESNGVPVCGTPHLEQPAVPRLDIDLLGKPMETEPQDRAPHGKDHGRHLRSNLVEWRPLQTTIHDGRKVIDPKDNNKTTARPTRISAFETRKHMEELQKITQDLGDNKSLIRQQYAEDLQRSLKALEELKKPQAPRSAFLFRRELSIPRGQVSTFFGLLKEALERPSSEMSVDHIWWLQQGGLWPAVTTVTLLEQLRSNSGTHFGSNMRGTLIAFGLAITRLQRSMRLNDCFLAGDVIQFQHEEANDGHSNWSPLEESDWLLLEIDSNFLIRPEQVQVARATISPASKSNSVLQMNMGQGKTSCIIPMAAASLADGKSLVRVIVPKALLLQTAQLLQSRLGGMLNRRICHVPFSRRTVTAGGSVELYYNIHKRLMASTGIMLCVPEHNLSFLLSGQQRVLDGKLNDAKSMIKVQSWFRAVCRDIIDESDYTLAARTQLIYPSGSQVSVDGHPHRWCVIEAILALVDNHLYQLKKLYPNSIEVVRRPGDGFPLIYFLRRDAEDKLLARLTNDITKFDHILPLRTFTRKERVAIRDFLASGGSGKLRADTINVIKNLRPDRPSVRQIAYLLRGLLVNRILIMTLKKRWNVQYGLRPNGDPVAVPFHAKGVPSEQSEWGHPDVAILFTCLAFYYEGVTKDQLHQALVRVKKSDDPAGEYDKWVINSTDRLPASLRSWNCINVEDAGQVHNIWTALRYQVVVVDYFLNSFVFPGHAKQFEVKLQSSGWDIPQFTAHHDEVYKRWLRQGAKPLTTGFSGTNDNRTMLPLTIRQADLNSLLHTNAEVLTYLLHDRSRYCNVITDQRGGRATERELLGKLKEMNISILIDAGALILEMNNEMLARTWLLIDGRKEAAVYFDSGNKAMVVSKTGMKTPLLASPYTEDLGKCLVYLDEAHTRGTDLKFPLDARGGLTVGQGQTKDHTVQAAMRLRQLGTSQSITFLVPPEVHQVILDLQGKTPKDLIDSRDVICWMLNNSCDGIEQLQPLYYSQGIDFCRRTQAAFNNPDFLTKRDQRDEYISTIKLNELQTLQEMYSPKEKTSRIGDLASTHEKVAEFAKELNRLRRGFQDTGRAVHASALQEVEQEREVAFEIEVEQQRKKPKQYEALKFPGLLARDVDIFARTGKMSSGNHGTSHYFHFLATTSLGRKYKIKTHGPHMNDRLFVSNEFKKTVFLYTDLSHDNFLRPVSYILFSALTATAIVIIPEEAEIIVKMIRASETHSQIHLMTYASPVTRKMLAFNSLKFYVTPELPSGWKAPQWLKISLGLLSGRLHFEWEEYSHLCDFLGVNDKHIDDEDNDKSDAGSDTEDSGAEDNTLQIGESTGGKTKSFCARPLVFLQEWLSLRRQGQDFAHTPMGFLVLDKLLHEKHAMFNDSVAVASEVGSPGGRSGSPTYGPRKKREEEERDSYFDAVDDMGANVEIPVGDERDEDWGSEIESEREDRDDDDFGEYNNGSYGDRSDGSSGDGYDWYNAV